MSIDEKKYWDDRYYGGYTSGPASYGGQLVRKVQYIKDNVRDIKNITDIGCGDFTLGAKLCAMFPTASYLGMDISAVVVERNKGLYPRGQFQVMSDIPKSDLLLCVDVLFHVLDDEECEKLIDNLHNSWDNYLVITAYERNEEKTNHVRIRKFPVEKFGTPIFKEEIEEGGLYLYIFKKNANYGRK